MHGLQFSLWVSPIAGGPWARVEGVLGGPHRRRRNVEGGVECRRRRRPLPWPDLYTTDHPGAPGATRVAAASIGPPARRRRREDHFRAPTPLDLHMCCTPTSNTSHPPPTNEPATTAAATRSFLHAPSAPATAAATSHRRRRAGGPPRKSEPVPRPRVPRAGGDPALPLRRIRRAHGRSGDGSAGRLRHV
jgi:hypothetical protein